MNQGTSVLPTQCRVPTYCEQKYILWSEAAEIHLPVQEDEAQDVNPCVFAHVYFSWNHRIILTMLTCTWYRDIIFGHDSWYGASSLLMERARMQSQCKNHLDNRVSILRCSYWGVPNPWKQLQHVPPLAQGLLYEVYFTTNVQSHYAILCMPQACCCFLLVCKCCTHCRCRACSIANENTHDILCHT